MTQIQEILDPKHNQLIYSLLKEKTKSEAARKAGVSPSTMYRRLRDPVFMTAYQAALRDRFHDAMAVLEKNAAASAQTMVDMAADGEEESWIRLGAAKGVLDRAFEAQNTIAVEEELTRLRAIIAQLRESVAAGPLPPPPPEKHMSEFEQAEACRLRVAWMGEIGRDAQDIETSLCYNRPQSVDEEAELLDMVRKQLEVERLISQVLA